MSTWGNVPEPALHNIYYRTPGRVQSAAGNHHCQPAGSRFGTGIPAGYPKTRNGHQAPVSGILPETWVGTRPPGFSACNRRLAARFGARQSSRIVELLGPPLVRYPSGGPHRGAHLVYSSTGTSKTGSSTFTTGTVGGDVIGTSSLDLAVLRNADNLNRLLDGMGLP